jgi:hypothetical protein
MPKQARRRVIDYQKEMFETIRSETSAELADLNVRLLARTAKAFNMPVVAGSTAAPCRPARCAHTVR